MASIMQTCYKTMLTASFFVIALNHLGVHAQTAEAPGPSEQESGFAGMLIPCLTTSVLLGVASFVAARLQ